jgi:pyrrolidone-carboxylate peptidase
MADLFLTSFGPFLDVLDNASNRIAIRLMDMLQRHDAIEVVEHRLLEVSLAPVRSYFESLRTMLRGKAQRLKESAHKRRIFLLHLGVHRGAHGEIRVESRGYNEAHFPSGDFSGLVLDHSPIVPGAATDAWVSTPVDRGRIVEALSTIKAGCSSVTAEAARVEPKLVVSDDAGRYLCNSCTFLSYSLAKEINEEAPGSVLALFIHVLDPEREECDGRLNPSCEAQAIAIFSFLTRLVKQI